MILPRSTACCWLSGMTIGRKVTDRQQAIRVHMRVKRQHQRWTLLHDPHAGMTMAMHPACVACGPLAPTLQVHLVGGKISGLAPYQQPWRKAAHDLGDMLVNGVRAGLPRLWP
jgi:hypothetical protein